MRKGAVEEEEKFEGEEGTTGKHIGAKQADVGAGCTRRVRMNRCECVACKKREGAPTLLRMTRLACAAPGAWFDVSPVNAALRQAARSSLAVWNRAGAAVLPQPLAEEARGSLLTTRRRLEQLSASSACRFKVNCEVIVLRTSGIQFLSRGWVGGDP